MGYTGGYTNGAAAAAMCSGEAEVSVSVAGGLDAMEAVGMEDYDADEHHFTGVNYACAYCEVRTHCALLNLHFASCALVLVGTGCLCACISFPASDRQLEGQLWMFSGVVGSCAEQIRMLCLQLHIITVYQ